MARHTHAKRPSSRDIAADKKDGKRRMSRAERSAYFARREAAKVLRMVLQGDANRRAVASIKSLIYRPSVRNKKGTFAFVCQTLKHLHVIKEILDASSILNSKWKRQEELILHCCLRYSFWSVSLVGNVEKFLSHHKDVLQSTLKQLLLQRRVTSVKQLVAL